MFINNTPLFLYDADKGGGKPPEKGGEDGNAKNDKTHTQADLDRIAGKTRKDVKASTTAGILEELGVENIAAAKAALKTAADAKQASLSELEKANQTNETLQAEIVQHKATADEAIQRANMSLMRAVVMVEAGKGEYSIHPEALADVWSFINKDDLTLTDAGKVEGAAAAVKAVLEAKPYLKAVASNGNAHPRHGRNRDIGDGKPKAEVARHKIKM